MIEATVNAMTMCWVKLFFLLSAVTRSCRVWMCARNICRRTTSHICSYSAGPKLLAAVGMQSQDMYSFSFAMLAESILPDLTVARRVVACSWLISNWFMPKHPVSGKFYVFALCRRQGRVLEPGASRAIQQRFASHDWWSARPNVVANRPIAAGWYLG